LLVQGIARGQRATLTAGEVVERIKKNVGVAWDDKSYRDTFKIAGPDAAVTGIACTFMSTLDVLQRASAAGKNMIITHEPTFWSDADLVQDLTEDPLYKYKLGFAVKNNLVVWRFHDHWHAMKPDGIYVGWNKALGWGKYLVGSGAPLYEIPPMTLEAAAAHVANSLHSRSVRVIGDPKLLVSKVGRGSHTLAGNMAVLPAVDMVLISEAREWDSIEYVRDTVLSGAKKGAVVISHEAGEEAGMDHCTDWLRTFIPEVPIEFIPTHDRLWIPA
jgi:putative NIF3 family GTP cyclohydrolase 1 type 2